jgi:isocitrate dehydrogenase (NAD+)
LIPGDGIGNEVADSVKEIFTSLNVPVQWEQYDVSGETHGNEAEFKRAMESLKRNKVGLKGILYTPIDGHNSWNVAMRQSLDIYANVVVCKSLPGVPTRHDNVDFAIIRENTEGEYAGLEHQSYPGVVENLKVMTRVKAERIARFAFDYALKNGRKKVTCVHKANIMKVSSRLGPVWASRYLIMGSTLAARRRSFLEHLYRGRQGVREQRYQVRLYDCRQHVSSPCPSLGGESFWLSI